MSEPWDPAAGHDGDAGHDGLDHGLPEEPAGWTDDSAGLPDEPAGWTDAHDATAAEEPAPWSSAHPEPAHPGLPAETPADWSDGTGPDESADWSAAGPIDGDLPAAGHADWSDLTADPDGGDDPDPGDPAGWGAPAEDPFPPALAVDVTPTDGGPWADPDLLGAEPEDAAPARTDPPLALLADLSAADGADDGGSGDWTGVEHSDDPAIRSLATYWRHAG